MLRLNFLNNPGSGEHRGSAGQKSSLLSEPAQLKVQILGDTQLAQLTDPPEKVPGVGSGHGYEDGGIVKVFPVGKTVFEKVAGAYGTGQIVVVGVGVAGLRSARLYADLLANLLNHFFFRLPFHKQIHIDAFAGIDQQAQPPGGDLGTVTGYRNHQVGTA